VPVFADGPRRSSIQVSEAGHPPVPVLANAPVPLFGSHTSVAGEYALAVARATALGCDSLQIFTRNPNQWRSAPLDALRVRNFRDALAKSHIGRVISHASYLINLAAPDGELRNLSLQAAGEELDRAEALGLEGVVFHPGHCGIDSEAVALDRIATAARALLNERKRARAMILFEHTAGQGRCVGYRFEHLALLLELMDGTPRVGVCLDTCHLLASGYDIVSAAGYRDTFRRFERLIGWDRLGAVHVNDSKTPRGSRVDRHAHVGEGHIGLEGFSRLVNDRRFARLPMVLETPKEEVRRVREVRADPLDAMNLARLRALVKPAGQRSQGRSRKV
jgi:deoxyribonuclease-4